MARTPKKNEEIILEYEDSLEIKVNKSSKKSTWKTISTAKDSSVKLK